MYAGNDTMLTSATCTQIWKIKKDINIKPSIYIKFGFHHYLFHDKILKTRLHLPIFAQYFFKKLFSVILNN